MGLRAEQVRFVAHGTGRPVLVLHGAGVDHREAEACFEPALAGAGGLRRVYPDLPGTGRTPATETVGRDRKSTRLNSSHANISYAVFCLKKKRSPLSSP